MRPRLAAARNAGRAMALATIARADGGPRPVGSQMAIEAEQHWGFLSGGCIEADVALNGRGVLEDRTPRRLIYGQGSPFIDIRLPCGGRLDILVEAIAPDDQAIGALLSLAEQRKVAQWQSDGIRRQCAESGFSGDLPDAFVRHVFLPRQRLLVIGSDAFALAIAQAGGQLGWDVRMLAEFAADDIAAPGVLIDRRPVLASLHAIVPDPWTAVAVATHEVDAETPSLAAALRSRAGYVGVLGSRRNLPERFAHLTAAGVSAEDLARLHAPIGLAIAARTPREVAVAVVAEIIAAANVPEG